MVIVAQENEDGKKKRKRQRAAKPGAAPQQSPPAAGPAMSGPADNRLVLGFNAAQRHLFMRVRSLVKVHADLLMEGPRTLSF